MCKRILQYNILLHAVAARGRKFCVWGGGGRQNDFAFCDTCNQVLQVWMYVEYKN
jgi:hypothetical protein